MTLRIPDLTLTDTERRLLLRLLDDKWWDLDTQKDKSQGDLMFLRDIETLQRKLNS